MFLNFFLMRVYLFLFSLKKTYIRKRWKNLYFLEPKSKLILTWNVSFNMIIRNVEISKVIAYFFIYEIR